MDLHKRGQQPMVACLQLLVIRYKVIHGRLAVGVAIAHRLRGAVCPRI
jgi:hypothetical protein